MNVSRKRCREGEACQPATYAEALHCLFQHGRLACADLPQALADRYQIHVTREMVYAWSNPYQADSALACPTRVLLAVTELQRTPVVLEPLLRRIGFGLEALPVGTCAAIDREFLDVAAVNGRLADEVRLATGDGHLDAVEAARMRVVLRDYKRQIADLEIALETAVGAQP